jgi:ElaB/YqjD/DUF883 family membrane-anchored ribosome-binding protein
MSDTAKNETSNVVPFRDTRAGHAIDDVASVVRDHPFLVIAGGLAIGVAIAALLPRRSTGRLSRSARHLAEVAGAAGLALGREVLEKGGQARETGLDLGRQAKDRAGVAGSQLRRQGEVVLDRAEDALSVAGDASQKLLRKASAFAGEIAGRVRR